jgi:protein-tyrosine phosphatase
MIEVRDWRNVEQRRDILHDAAQALAAGKLVAFPVETGCAVAASALFPAAVQKLVAWPRLSREGSASVLLNTAGALSDWAPDLGRVGQRLTRRCWPGPVQFVVSEGTNRGLASRLQPEVRRFVLHDSDLNLRVPAHDAIRYTSRLLPGCLVVGETECRAREAEALESCLHPQAMEALQQELGGEIALAVQDEPGQYNRPVSVVRLHGESWQLIRDGAVSAAALGELAACMIVFVCTGNTCRSPLAEGLCKKLLAERLQCGAEELPAKGFVVLSAGLSAVAGCRAAEEAVATARKYSVDLESHLSRPMSPTLMRQADHVFAMTQSHLRTITTYLPGAGSWVRLLAPHGSDIPDPIGGDEEIYQRCAEQILECLQSRLAEI